MANKTPLGSMIIELGLDDSDFGKGVTNVKKQVNYLYKEMQANMKISDLAGNQLGVLGNKYNGLSKIIEAQEKKVELLKKQYNESLDETGKATTSTVRYATELQQATGQLASYKKQLANTAGEMAAWKVQNEGLTGALHSFGEGLTTVGKKASSLGSALTKSLSLPLAAGITLVTKAAMNWESSFAGVIKTNDEVVDSNGNVVYSYQDLEDGLRNLTKELPATHSEIAAVAESAGQLGIATEEVVSFTKTMIDLGESTNLSAEDAATSIAKLANITGLTADEYERFGSTLVALGNNFATTEADILNMAMNLSSAGTQVGMSESQILALATALSSVGLEAQAGGTAFSKALVAMQLAVETNSEDLKSWASVAGMSTQEFATAFKEDATGALQAFIQGLSQAGEESESAIKILDDMGITETRLRDALLRSANASDIFTDAIELGSKAWDENTALSEEAEKRYETVESQLAMLKNEVVDVAIEFGGPFLEALRSGLTAVKPFIEKLAELAKKFSDASPETQKMIMKVLAFTVAVGPALKIVGSLSTGIGGLTKNTIGFLAELAKKKTITSFSTELASGATNIASFGSAAATASGASGVGAMTSALGALGPVALGIVGVGGVLAVGYGAWKLFGEEAWNSSQRVARWGTDVGETTDKTLLTIQENTQAASGQFTLMADGLSVNTQSMVDNFETIGSTIETSLTNQIDALRETINLLPADIQAAASEIIEGAISEREQALQIVQENSERIQEIKANYNDENGELTLQGAQMIQDLMEQSTQEYLKITIEDADQRLAVTEALNGDIEKATEEQAKSWLVSLAEQRQATKDSYNKDLKIIEDYLEEANLLHTDAGQQILDLFEQSREASTDSLDAQTALILEKYPELIDEVFLANGQLASELGGYSNSIADANQIVLDKGNKLLEEYRKNATQTSDALKWTANEATEAGKTWNALELLGKEGNVKTNASEIVIEATKDIDTWNSLLPVVHEADLDSNAKAIIAEAALMNGYWDDMTWEDKSAILNNSFSQNVYKAMEESGEWNELTFEEKNLILYSNTPEKMAETLLNLGQWDKYKLAIKHLEIENFDFLSVLSQSEDKLNHYNSLPSETKDLLADNYDLLTKIYESDEVYNRWVDLPDNEKQILANNTDLLEQVLESDQKYNDWRNLPDDTKNMYGNNSDVLAKVGYAGIAVKTYNETTANDKTVKVNDEASAPARAGVEAIQWFNRQQGKAVTLTTILKTITEKVTQNAKGTSFHPGGAMIVNDQKGPLYKELVVYPTGKAFIPEGRDVFLNAPRGTKVFTATQTKRLVPNYADGVGVPKNADVIKTIDSINERSQTTNINISTGNCAKKLDELIALLKSKQDAPVIKEMNVTWKGEEDIRKTWAKLGWIAGNEGSKLE